jgi:hypothetical protein
MIGFLLVFSVPVSAQWATIARKVKSMRTGKTDVATVLVDARTYRVYGAVTDSLASDPKFKILSRDNTKRLVKFTNGTFTVSMQVDSIAVGLSQITVAADHSDDLEKQATDVAVEAVFRVCQKVGIRCTLDK